MGAIHYEVVQVDGSFKRYNTIDELKDIGDFFFIVEKEEGYHCATYSHYHARIIDKDGNPTQVDYKGYIFRIFSISGQAGNYILSIRFDMPHGQGSKLREFHKDISYNHTYEAYSMIKPEWDYGTQYKDLLNYFEELDKYGVDAYDRILELEEEQKRVREQEEKRIRLEAEELEESLLPHFKEKSVFIASCLALILLVIIVSSWWFDEIGWFNCVLLVAMGGEVFMCYHSLFCKGFTMQEVINGRISILTTQEISI